MAREARRHWSQIRTVKNSRMEYAPSFNMRSVGNGMNKRVYYKPDPRRKGK